MNRRAFAVTGMAVTAAVLVWIWLFAPSTAQKGTSALEHPTPGEPDVAEINPRDANSLGSRQQIEHREENNPVDMPSSAPPPPSVSPEYDELFSEERKDPAFKELDPVTEQVVLGEKAFMEGDLETAYDYFSEVVENDTDHPKAPFALYRLAWVEYKMGEVNNALEDMTEAVEWATDQSDGTGSSKWLIQQTRRDLETLQIHNELTEDE